MDRADWRKKRAWKGENTAAFGAVTWHRMLISHRSPAAGEGHGWTKETIREPTARVLVKKDSGLGRFHS